ncbi:VOC family protein [Deinococcus hopiensis]|uniref:Glyoxalase/fosfomycin resistance/dioxygenase domain-containing protein n=1 Tax=Deinococcus hopiensis KR-140 TaxID=695939 RepID=A0A1W1V5E7_9DEIO|nr:VOC family protein [Deinococcus hopiensis]SMB88380.1 hypothetical protein SAMN00790413_00022 [Deinococcus hopiensis KR-140]
MKTNPHFTALHTWRLNAAQNCCVQTLGFEVVQEQPGATVFARLDGAALAVREPLPERDPSQPFGGRVWVGMPETERYHAQVAAAGAQVVQPPQDAPFGRMFTPVTPGGHALTFHEVQE